MIPQTYRQLYPQTHAALDLWYSTEYRYGAMRDIAQTDEMRERYENNDLQRILYVQKAFLSDVQGMLCSIEYCGIRTITRLAHYTPLPS